MSLRYKELIRELGDLRDYTGTGWYYSTDPDDWGWKPRLSSGAFEELPREDQQPEATNYCQCKKYIVNHHLIRHLTTGEYFFVGCVCIKHFKGLQRRCPACRNPHRCKTEYCKNCRSSYRPRGRPSATQSYTYDILRPDDNGDYAYGDPLWV